MAIKSNYVLQKNFTNFYKPQFQTGPTKNPKKRRKNCNILGSKTSENARWTLPVYPVLKAQGHEKRCENILQKQKKNIAGRFPENSRNRFVDRQSKKKTEKKTDQKNSSFHWRLIC